MGTVRRSEVFRGVNSNVYFNKRRLIKSNVFGHYKSLFQKYSKTKKLCKNQINVRHQFPIFCYIFTRSEFPEYGYSQTSIFLLFKVIKLISVVQFFYSGSLNLHKLLHILALKGRCKLRENCTRLKLYTLFAKVATLFAKGY